jgi:uncharacterized protein
MANTRGLAAVTGASAGIGAVFARALAARGHDLLLIARRDDRLLALADEITQAYGVQCKILTANLTLDSDIARVEEQLRAATNLTMLVNNAGFGVVGPFVDLAKLRRTCSNGPGDPCRDW